MSKPAFLADHNFNEAIVEGIERAEPAIQIIRLREVGLEAASDPDVLEYAANQKLILLSHDVNTLIADAFDRLNKNQIIAGVFLVRSRPPAIRAIIENLLLIWAASEAEEWSGKIVFLPLS